MTIKAPKAALLMIGNEILSGRTQDKNLNYLAQALLKHGIIFCEARIVKDDENAIIFHINQLRKTYDYVFSCGGIGPTHDDITAASIAKALDLELIYHPLALEILEAHYSKTNRLLTDNRKRMARTPKGAKLIKNLISGAPGIIIENIYIMAGVPAIFAAMVDAVMPDLNHGPEIHSFTYGAMVAESEIAEGLTVIARNHPNIDIGCYPAWTNRLPCVSIVARSTDLERLSKADNDLKALLSTFDPID